MSRIPSIPENIGKQSRKTLVSHARADFPEAKIMPAMRDHVVKGIA